MLIYKTDILQALKSAGYNTYKIKTDNLLSQGVLQRLRHDEPISWANLDTLCSLLQCQPGDIIAYIPDDQQQNAKP